MQSHSFRLLKTLLKIIGRDQSSGWRQHGSNCYKFKSETMKSWSAARHDCVEEGGDLVSITSQAENTYVMGTLSSTHLDFWIGLSTLHDTNKTFVFFVN
uniref:C-type lectin domain-containing protein n=1 Tax=Poecilia mexicana TaxID=48701 RepID=A0A3B3XQ52_9TELE